MDVYSPQSQLVAALLKEVADFDNELSTRESVRNPKNEEERLYKENLKLNIKRLEDQLNQYGALQGEAMTDYGIAVAEHYKIDRLLG